MDSDLEGLLRAAGYKPMDHDEDGGWWRDDGKVHWWPSKDAANAAMKHHRAHVVAHRADKTKAPLHDRAAIAAYWFAEEYDHEDWPLERIWPSRGDLWVENEPRGFFGVVTASDGTDDVATEVRLRITSGIERLRQIVSRGVKDDVQVNVRGDLVFYGGATVALEGDELVVRRAH